MTCTRPVITLLTSPGCHLCESARDDLTEVTLPLGLEWIETDVTENLEMLRRFKNEIPVLMIDGVPRDFWRIDKPRIRHILEGLMRGEDPEG